MTETATEIMHQLVALPGYMARLGDYWNEMGWIFRGQAMGVEVWPLLPKAGRPEYFTTATDYWKDRKQNSGDLGKFRKWRRNAIAFSEKLPTNDFDCLAYAQHYGLATRLLDWTRNPLVALFFTVEAHQDQDGAVFCHSPWDVIIPEEASLEDVNIIARLETTPFDRRIDAQSGLFTYHPDPKQPIVPKLLNTQQQQSAPKGIDKNLVTLRIDARMKPILQRQLSTVGISRKTLFPDLEGLSSFINWDTRRFSDAETADDGTAG